MLRKIAIACLCVLATSGCRTLWEARSSDRIVEELKPVETSTMAAVKTYGWALPLCVRRIGEKEVAFCTTYSELFKAHPISSESLVIQSYKELDRLADSSRLTGSRGVGLINALLDQNAPVGCVAAGANKGVITLGSPEGQSEQQLAEQDEACDIDVNSRSFDDLVYGLAVGSMDRSPGSSFSRPGQTRYEEYRAQCESERLINGQSPVSGSVRYAQFNSDAARQAVTRARQDVEDKRRRVEEAEADLGEAEQEVQSKEEALVEAEARNEAVLADPRSTAEEKLVAAQAVLTAQSELTYARLVRDDAVRQAEEADEDLANAEQAVTDSISDLQAALNREELSALGVEATEDMAAAFGTCVLGFVAYPICVAGHQVQWAARMAGINAGSYSAKDCADETQCGMSCEEVAAARALEEEYRKYFDPEVCNFAVRTLPGDDTCYDRMFGITPVPEVTAIEAMIHACEMREKISDVDCETTLETFLKSREYEASIDEFVDPCNGPLVLCGPDQLSDQDLGQARQIQYRR